MSDYSLREVLTPPIKRILAGVGLNAFGNGLTLSLLLVYLTQIRGIPVADASLVLSWQAIIGLSMTGPVGSLVDRVGAKRVLLVGLVIQSLGVASFSLVHTLPQALMASALASVGGAAIWPPQSTLMAQLSPADHRQRVFGVNFMLLNAGLGAGGLVAALLIIDGDAASFERLYLFNAVSYFAYFLLALGVPQPPIVAAEAEVDMSAGYREVLADRRILRLVGGSLVLLVFGYSSIEAGLSIFVTAHVGLSAKTLGIIFGVNTASIVLIQPFVLKWSYGRSRTLMMLLVGLMWSVSWAIVGLTAGLHGAVALGMLCFSQFIFAIGETLWSPVGPAIANDLAPPHLRGRYNALSSIQWGLSSSIGPLVAGLLLGNGHPRLWAGTAALGTLIAGWLLLSLRSQLTAAEDGRIDGSARESLG